MRCSEASDQENEEIPGVVQSSYGYLHTSGGLGGLALSNGNSTLLKRSSAIIPGKELITATRCVMQPVKGREN